MDMRTARWPEGATRRSVRAAPLVLLCCAFSANSAPPQCATVRPSSMLKPAYARVAKSDFCEGFYERDVSQPFLELVSFTMDPPEAFARMGKLDRIKLQPAGVSMAAMLSIQPLSVSVLYRVDASLAAGGLEWSSKQLRSATGLSLADVGFLATAGRTASGALIVVPLTVENTVKDAKTAFVVVRVSAKTTSLKWRAYPTHRTQAQSPDWHETLEADQPLYPWESTTVSIPLSADGAGLTVEIKGKVTGAVSAEPLRLQIAGNDHERN